MYTRSVTFFVRCLVNGHTRERNTRHDVRLTLAFIGQDVNFFWLFNFDVYLVLALFL